jgi:hypothetical protein
MNADAHEFLERTFMMIPFRLPQGAGKIGLEPELKGPHHEMGNPGSRRFPLRHGNHDVRGQSVKRGRALPATAGSAFSLLAP